MALREIRTFDDEFLHKVSRRVDKVDDHIREILNDMAETMYSTQNGGGLAACQVGILRRLVVADMGQGLLKLINPQIVESEGEQLVIEGCLSYPGIWGKVLRPKRVLVKALNENGENITIEAFDELAKCLCHETDHLDGILFTDKVIEYVEIK
ncbi:peptide deformylase [Geosporobacter ferrireducens]|uniref:Peptide deformylase n=1 Tax=Geosporobacter ferrireducens TaxID=1424294 RepID=A0A1D8GKN1_9FIRM|nr:peptide deformylase [Geosporobacter ferrireducens]AOT71457.1 peptide deformylase [Geosporobacter ferrireducens]MTI57765.1 peptide deformylase [Geosporobacter ferrireducens]